MLLVYQRTVELGDLTPRQFLMLCALSMDDLSWDRYIVDDTRVQARAHMGILSWGEIISVTTREGKAILNSKHPEWKLLKPKRSENNILSLMEYMEHNRQIYSPEQLEQLFEEQAQNKGPELQPTEKIIMSPVVPLATAILVALTIGCYLFFGFSTGRFMEASVMDLFAWGGNIRLHTLGGQGWRLLTACFLHLNILHLLSNMFILFFIGRLIEPVLGRYGLVVCYLCTGVIGSLVSVMVAGNRISAGASGAVFGLFGVFLALLTTSLLTGEMKRVLFKGIFLLAAYGLFEGMSGGVDNAGHVGGLLSGFVFGYIIYAGYRTAKRRFMAVTVVLLVTLSTTAFSLYYFHNDTVVYERMLNRMNTLENNAWQVRLNHRDRSNAENIRNFKKIAGPAWIEFTTTIDSARNFRFGNNKVYGPMQKLLYRYGVLRQRENDIWIKGFEGKDVEEQKDSIRIMLNDITDSLTVLRNQQ